MEQKIQISWVTNGMPKVRRKICFYGICRSLTSIVLYPALLEKTFCFFPLMRMCKRTLFLSKLFTLISAPSVGLASNINIITKCRLKIWSPFNFSQKLKAFFIGFHSLRRHAGMPQYWHHWQKNYSLPVLKLFPE